IRSASGCHDKVIAVEVFNSPLPIRLSNFQGNINNNNRVTLQWKVENNETIDQFEVQKSFDGKEFKTIGLVFASEKSNTEDYMFYETVNSFEKIMYRLKIIGKTNEVSYSRILAFQNKITTNNNLKIIGNPVNDQLTLNYTASADKMIDIRIYDMTGRMVMSNKMNSFKGENMISFALTPTMIPNMYTVEVNDGKDIQTKKFLKQPLW